MTWHLSGPKPYDVQIEALKRSDGAHRYGYWLEQGLGKTPLTLNDYIEQHTDYSTIVMLCPNTFKGDWKLAPAEWGVPEIKGSVWPYDDFKFGTTDHPHMNIMNYEAVRSAGYNHVRALMDKQPCVFVVDESSAIKNFKSDTARAVSDLAKRAKIVRLLNGTPMVQNPMDLFPQLKCLGELQGVNPFAFRNRYTIMGGWMGKQIIGIKNEEELHEIQKRVSFRALKKDWSDLPEKINIPVRLEMTDRQRKHYKEMMDEFCTMLGGHTYEAPLVLVMLDKCRQIASGILMDGDKFKLIEEPKNNPKIKAAFDIIEAGTGKTIIVHFYKRMGTVILEEMRKAGLNPAFIRGGMEPGEIKEQKDKFNQNSDSRILVAQITATSMAHTLIGGAGDDRCHKMIFHDQTFSLKDRYQMEDRIHRGAQDRACLYYDPIMSPIDEAQLAAVTKKADMVAVVVDAIRALRGTPSV